MEHLCTGTDCWICGEPRELRDMRHAMWKSFYHVNEAGLTSAQCHNLANLAARTIRDDVIGLMTKIEELAAELYVAKRGKLTRVEIDPNVRVRGNQTVTSIDNAHGPVAVGSWVTVYESEADIEGDAWVTDISSEHPDRTRVYLNVIWSSLHTREKDG